MKMPFAPNSPPPKQPMFPAPKPADPYAMHPVVQEWAATYSDAMRERDWLRGELARVQNELEVERRHTNELQYMVDAERERRSFFERYAVEVNTHLENIQESATRARARSVEAARAIEKTRPPDPEQRVEDEIAKVVQARNHNTQPEKANERRDKS